MIILTKLIYGFGRRFEGLFEVFPELKIVSKGVSKLCEATPLRLFCIYRSERIEKSNGSGFRKCVDCVDLLADKHYCCYCSLHPPGGRKWECLK